MESKVGFFFRGSHGFFLVGCCGWKTVSFFVLHLKVGDQEALEVVG